MRDYLIDLCKIFAYICISLLLFIIIVLATSPICNRLDIIITKLDNVEKSMVLEVQDE